MHDTMKKEAMHTTEILLTGLNRQIGPTFFSGPGSEYPYLAEARAAAKKWVQTQGYLADEYAIISSAVGFL